MTKSKLPCPIAHRPETSGALLNGHASLRTTLRRPHTTLPHDGHLQPRQRPPQVPPSPEPHPTPPHPAARTPAPNPAPPHPGPRLTAPPQTAGRPAAAAATGSYDSDGSGGRARDGGGSENAIPNEWRGAGRGGGWFGTGDETGWGWDGMGRDLRWPLPWL